MICCLWQLAFLKCGTAGSSASRCLQKSLNLPNPATEITGKSPNTSAAVSLQVGNPRIQRLGSSGRSRRCPHTWAGGRLVRFLLSNLVQNAFFNRHRVQVIGITWSSGGRRWCGGVWQQPITRVIDAHQGFESIIIQRIFGVKWESVQAILVHNQDYQISNATPFFWDGARRKWPYR